MPQSGTPTVAWYFRESSTINPVVADLLIIWALMNRQFCITPSVFYHPGHLNTMAEFVMRPCGFSKLTRSVLISSGQGKRHT